jgi:hypothetical protein
MLSFIFGFPLLDGLVGCVPPLFFVFIIGVIFDIYRFRRVKSIHKHFTGLIQDILMHELAVFDRGVILNIIAQLIFDALIVYFLGWPALAYLGLSFLFSVGLHPLGARWIQEHNMVIDKMIIYLKSFDISLTKDWLFLNNIKFIIIIDLSLNQW